LRWWFRDIADSRGGSEFKTLLFSASETPLDMFYHWEAVRAGLPEDITVISLPTAQVTGADYHQTGAGSLRILIKHIFWRSDRTTLRLD
jgi:hypothetical protein